jgi:hypothetical protein
MVTGKFTVTDDSGHLYQIIEYTQFNRTDIPGSDSQRAEGLKEYELDNGSPVIEISATEFEIAVSGVRLTGVRFVRVK